MTDYLRNEKNVALARGAVPDPYYGGPQGFDTVLDLLEDACEGLLDAVAADARSRKADGKRGMGAGVNGRGVRQTKIRHSRPSGVASN